LAVLGLQAAPVAPEADQRLVQVEQPAPGLRVVGPDALQEAQRRGVGAVAGGGCCLGGGLCPRSISCPAATGEGMRGVGFGCTWKLLDVSRETQATSRFTFHPPTTHAPGLPTPPAEAPSEGRIRHARSN